MAEKKIKIRADKVTLNYRHEGEGKINILFLHGWSIDSSYWKDQIDLLKDNYSVYAIDLPGFGNSKAPERDVWSMEEYAYDVRDFMKHLELENIILVGHSMSGGIMLDVAVQSSPEEIIGLIAVDTLKTVGIEMTPDVRGRLTDYSSMLQTDYKEAVKTYAESMLFTSNTTAEVRDRVLKDFSNVDPKIGISTFKSLSSNYENLPGKLELIPQVLYLINSDNIPTNELGLKNYCKNGYELVTVHGTGHYPMIEKKQEFNMLLKGVVDRIAHTFENELTARVTARIKAPIEKVWNALTNPELISQYMYGTKVESEWQTGKSIKWRGIWNGKLYEDKGTILLIDPPHSLKYSYFSNLSDLPDKPENYNIVTYELAEITEGTSVLITQTNNRSIKQRNHSEKSWEEVLKEMKKVIQ